MPIDDSFTEWLAVAAAEASLSSLPSSIDFVPLAVETLLLRLDSSEKKLVPPPGLYC